MKTETDNDKAKIGGNVNIEKFCDQVNLVIKSNVIKLYSELNLDENPQRVLN